LAILEIDTLTPTPIGPLTVTSYPARHTPATQPTSVRVEAGGRIVAYTGDSAWTEHMPALARGADLLIAECYFHGKPVPLHLNWPDIEAHRAELACKRLVLTHMSPEMLARTA